MQDNPRRGDAASPGSHSLQEVVREVYIEQKSGILEVKLAAEARRFYFVGGELHLVDGHPLARRLSGLLQGDLELETAAIDVSGDRLTEPTPRFETTWPAEAQEELKGLIARIARFLVQLNDGDFHFREGSDGLPEGLVGPLPTGYLVMEMAVVEQDDLQLVDRLGGIKARLGALNDGGRLEQLFWLDTEEAFLLSRLEVSMDLGEILSQAGAGRASMLRRLVRLKAIGLIQPPKELPHKASDPGDDLVSAGILHRFRSRIAEDLENKPLQLEIDDHRQRLAESLATLGERNYYELLEVRHDATPEEVHASYETLARLVHPRHAIPLSLEGKEPALELLFERATRAYLTLNDPQRRSTYDRKMEINPLDEQDVDQETRHREVAREYFQLARRMVDTQQYHSAYQLLRDATQKDPRPEYFALLGQVQSKNPNWIRQAVESYREALELAPNSAEVRLGLALICEQAGFDTEAKLQFEGVLSRVPGHPAALDGLARLADTGEGDKDSRSWWQKLFRLSPKADD
ncbi:MAG: DnaJ domain-containing protein [Deltaproteobacteria bacterium]|nr:DnaJ domain-containing protein [Deltaproteobacteria bacterium]